MVDVEEILNYSRGDAGRCHVQTFRVENACLFVTVGRRKEFKLNYRIARCRRSNK